VSSVATYLDKLTPGMKARLDPTFRLLTSPKPVYHISIPRRNVDFLHSKPTMLSITKRKSSR